MPWPNSMHNPPIHSIPARSTRSRTWPRARAALWAALIACALAAALALRLYGIGWGLPYTDHPDEPSAVNRVFGMLRHNDWNPRFFGKPSLFYYALRVVFDVHLRYGVATGLYQGIESLPSTTDLYVTTPGFFVWGRVLTALLGTATVALAYALGRRWWGRWPALIGAALLAVAPFHVRNSQYITQDVPVTFTALIALLAALAPLRRPTWRSYALAGLCIGLATSTKYNAAMVALALVVVHVQVWGWASLRKGWLLAMAGALSLAAFVAGTPYALLAPEAFWHGVTHQYVAYNPTGGGGDLIKDWPVLEYLQFFWESGLTPLPCLAALVGVGVLVARRDRAGLAVLAVVLCYPLMFLPQQIQFFRNLLPIIPPLFVFAGVGVVACAHWALLLGHHAVRRWPGLPRGPRVARRVRALALPLVALGLAVPPLRAAIAQDTFHAYPHSKVLAGRYVRQQLSQGAPLALALNHAQWGDWPMAVTTEDVAEHDAAWYRSQGFRYIVADVKKASPASYPALRDASTVLQVFPGEAQGRPGTLLELLDLGSHPEELAIQRSDAAFGTMRLLGFQAAAGDLRGRFTPLHGPAQVQPGQALQLNLYWQPAAALDRDYAIFLHLVNQQGQTVAQRDTIIRADDYPTSRWRAGELVVDLADLPIEPELPNGRYRLNIGVYDMASGARLPLPGSADSSLDLLTVELAGRSS
ncbi:phospholipid carrier-dependent glycosyltransferase [Chloroflexia bacterium SDU3-3]|nr:phospholipid carrier-dependent glycosyltransferase [Chloroflexia bacterium SDU3-3]